MLQFDILFMVSKMIKGNWFNIVQNIYRAYSNWLSIKETYSVSIIKCVNAVCIWQVSWYNFNCILVN